MGKIIIAKPDKSSFKEKLDSLIRCGYLKRNRWDSAARICVLESEEDYSDLYFCKKNEIEKFVRFNENRHKTIVTTVFRPCCTNLLVATTLHYSENLPLKYYKGDAFASTSVLLNAQTTKTCLKGGETAELLDFVQLSRYDPVEEHYHVNDLSKIPNEQYELYSKYYKQVCPAPHFYFASKQNACLFGNPTHLAIDLHSLIHYVENLMNNHSSLQKDSMGLPIIKIKYNPKIYQTTTNISLFKIQKKYGVFSAELQKDVATLLNYSKANQAQKLANNMLNAKAHKFYGLQALYIDLILLAGLTDGFSPGLGGCEGAKIEDELMLSSKIMSIAQDVQACKYTEKLHQSLFKHLDQEIQKGVENEF